MPQEEKPTGSAATPEERRAALAAGDDVFDEGTTDNSAASLASPEDLEAARLAEEELKKQNEEGEEKPSDEGDGKDEALAAALNNLAASLPKKEEPKAKEMTPEELDEALNKFQISDDLLAELDNPETRKEALRKITAGAAKEGATLASILMSEEMGKLRNAVAPLLQAQQQQQLESQRRGFLEEYPSLDDEAFTPIIEIAAAQLQKEGKVPKTVTEARQLLAERAGGLIKKVNPAFDVKAKSAQQKQQTKTTVPKQATGTPKAGGGGGGGTSKTIAPAERNRSAGVEVFD